MPETISSNDMARRINRALRDLSYDFESALLVREDNGDYEINRQDAVTGGLILRKMVTTSFEPVVRFIRGRGTLFVPTALGNNDILGRVEGYGHDGTVEALGARISFQAGQAWTSTAHGTRILFAVTPDGSTATSTQMQLTEAGDLVLSNDLSVTGDGTLARLRLTATDDASLSSTLHAFQIGPTGGNNIVADPNEIMARNNGAASDLFLQNQGGAIVIGSDPGGTKVLRVGSGARINGTIASDGIVRIGSGAVASFAASLLVTDTGANCRIVVRGSAVQAMLLAEDGAAVIGAFSNHPVHIRVNNALVAHFDGSTTADDIRFLVYDVTAGAIVRVSRGATDSGGTGFRLLRVPN